MIRAGRDQPLLKPEVDRVEIYDFADSFSSPYFRTFLYNVTLMAKSPRMTTGKYKKLSIKLTGERT